MSQPIPAVINAHWYKLNEHFNYSTQDYYQQIEEVLRSQHIPDIKISLVEYKEGGVFSAKRTYLRVQRGQHVFDICAAPFGTSYFFSWWRGELRRANIFVVMGMVLGLLIAGLVALAIVGTIFTSLFGYFVSTVFTFLSIPLLFWVIIQIIRANPMGVEDTIMELPLIGPWYQLLFRPATYYKMDTALMFQSAVHSVVTQVVNAISEAQGIRALTEAERKPIMREFYQR